MPRIIRVLSMALAALVCLNAMPIAAQSGNRVIAQVTRGENQPLSLQIFSSDRPGLPQTISRGVISADANPTISPDASWLALQGFNATTHRSTISYGLISDEQKVVPVPAKRMVMSLSFSADSKYLTFTTVADSPEVPEWELNFLELETGVLTQFSGKYTFDAAQAQAGVFHGVAYVLEAWASTDLSAPLGSYIPYTDGNFQSFYVLDLSGVDLKRGGVLPLPPTKELYKVQSGFMAMAFSPDRAHVAITYSDNSNPPDNFEAMGPGSSASNGIRVLSLTSGALTDVPVNRKLGIGNLLWFDATTLLYTSGPYQKSDSIVSPRLEAYNISTSVTTSGPLLGVNDTEFVSQVQLCGDRMYFTTLTRQTDTAASTPTISRLYGASIGNIEGRVELAQGQMIMLLTCAK